MIRLLLAGCCLFACAKGGKDQPNPAVDAPATIDSPVPEIDAPVVAPDANTCATQPCDILTQCGCPANDACDLDGADLVGTVCRSVVSPGTETNTCSFATRCAKGYVCLGAGTGFCKKYCGSDADCLAPRGKCVIDIQSGGMPIAGIPSVCSSNCDPTNAAAGLCPTGFKCGLFTATHAGTTHNIADCAGAGSGVQAADCKAGANGNDLLCGVDFLCTTVNAGTNFNCRRMCNRGLGNAGCGVGAPTCIGFDPALTVGGTEYGVCSNGTATN